MLTGHAGARLLVVAAGHLADGSDVVIVGILHDQVAQLRQQRSLNILQDALVEAHAKARVLLLVELDEELRGVERALVAVPLEEVLMGLLVLEDGAKAAQGDALQSVVADLNQVEQDLNALDIEEVQL